MLVLDVKFNHEDGVYTQDKCLSDFNSLDFFGRTGDIVQNQLRGFTPANQHGNSRTGIAFRANLPPSNEYFLCYQLRFSSNWDTQAKGGKLPGLGGGVANSGGNKPIGDGWSARYMFRPNLRLVLYLYHMDQPGVFGQDFNTNVFMATGVWYTITQRIKLNTENNNDGIFQIWIGNQLVASANNIRFRIEPLAPINKFMFSHFMGGSDNTWGLSEDGYTYFDNIRIGTSFDEVQPDTPEPPPPPPDPPGPPIITGFRDGTAVFLQSNNPESLIVEWWRDVGANYELIGTGETFTDTLDLGVSAQYKARWRDGDIVSEFGNVIYVKSIRTTPAVFPIYIL